MDEDKEEYVRSCNNYQQNKASQYRKIGLHQLLEVPYRPSDSISMNFIVTLPESNGHTEDWVIVDHCRKSSQIETQGLKGSFGTSL